MQQVEQRRIDRVLITGTEVAQMVIDCGERIGHVGPGVEVLGRERFPGVRVVKRQRTAAEVGCA